jgi:hypothetical protein
MQINLQEKEPVDWREDCMVRAGAALFLSGLTGGGNLKGRISDAKTQVPGCERVEIGREKRESNERDVESQKGKRGKGRGWCGNRTNRSDRRKLTGWLV